MEELILTDQIEFTDFEAWKREVELRYPEAQWITEDGSGKTYGEVGDLTVALGPDMQADVVAIWNVAEGYGNISV